jgi:hypothetical protein
LSVFIESVLAASDFVVSLLVLCAASPLVVVELVLVWLCASAGFTGVAAWAIMCGVVLSDCGVAVVSSVLLGVAVLSGVVLLLGAAVVLLELLPFL